MHAQKAARLLGLKVGGGGGPAVEALALKGDPSAVPLAVPMQVFSCRFLIAFLRQRWPPCCSALNTLLADKAEASAWRKAKHLQGD